MFPLKMIELASRFYLWVQLAGLQRSFFSLKACTLVWHAWGIFCKPAPLLSYVDTFSFPLYLDANFFPF